MAQAKHDVWENAPAGLVNSTKNIASVLSEVVTILVGLTGPGDITENDWCHSSDVIAVLEYSLDQIERDAHYILYLVKHTEERLY